MEELNAMVVKKVGVRDEEVERRRWRRKERSRMLLVVLKAAAG